MSECTPADQAFAATPSRPYCLSHGETIGLTMKTEAGFLSGVAVAVVLALIIRNYLRRMPGQKLIRQPMDVYMLSLFIADLIQALGAIVNVKWLNEGKVFVGPLCSAQGIIQQVGETSAAMHTTIIAVHTFVVLWWGAERWYQTVTFAAFVSGAVWLLVILFVAIVAGTHRDPTNRYDTPTPDWCWVSEKHIVYGLAGEYIWIWLALGCSLALYGLLFFWSQGFVTKDERSWWGVNLHWRHRQITDLKDQNRMAYNMIAYPVSYALLVIPASAVRWTFIRHQLKDDGKQVKSSTLLGVMTIFSFSGLVNVLLFFFIRSNLLLFGNEKDTTAPFVLPAGPEFHDAPTSA